MGKFVRFLCYGGPCVLCVRACVSVRERKLPSLQRARRHIHHDLAGMSDRAAATADRNRQTQQKILFRINSHTHTRQHYSSAHASAQKHRIAPADGASAPRAHELLQYAGFRNGTLGAWAANRACVRRQHTRSCEQRHAVMRETPQDVSVDHLHGCIMVNSPIMVNDCSTDHVCL